MLKTDQTILAENILCKLFCLVLIAITLRKKRWKWREIGFQRHGLLKGLACGLALGIGTFALAYLAEFILLLGMGKQPRLSFYISNFALANQNITGFSFSAILICLIGNLFNVWAEEGLFRGLFLKLGKDYTTEKKANLLQSLLFGIWHIVMVAGWVIDGDMSIAGAIPMAAGYVLLAGILAYEWGLCVLLTGTVWTGVFEHAFNNLIGNSLHMITETGTDELQIFRIVLSNLLSLSIVLVIAKRSKKKNKTILSCT